MDLNLTDEQQMIKETMKRFTDEEIVPVARENDINESFPRDILNKIASLGFLGGPIEEKYGGAGMEYISYGIMIEEIGRGCSSVRTTLSVQISLVGLTIQRWGSEEQKEKYLPMLCSGDMIGCFGLTEPGAGSDAVNQSTTALLKKDEWVINGTKTWISNGGVADLAIVFAQTDKKKGHKGLAAFLIERGTHGFSTIDIRGKLGLRSSNTAQLIMENCWIPKANILGEVGDGFKIAMSALDNGRYSVAAGCVGIVQGCIDASIRYAKERKQFDRPIASFQLVQDMIARMIVDREAAILLVYNAGHLKNKGIMATKEISIAKYFASEASMRAATDAIQIHGGYGYSNEYPVERYFRDAKVSTIYEGTSQIQKLIIGRDALGIQAIR